MNDNKIQTMIVGIRKNLEDVFHKMDEIELQLQDIMTEMKIVDGPEVMKELDVGDMMMRNGGISPPLAGLIKVEPMSLPQGLIFYLDYQHEKNSCNGEQLIPVDLPDEMFEDMLHAEVRNKTGKTGGKTYVSPATCFWTDKSGALKLGSSRHITADQRYGYEAKGYGCLYPGTCHVVSPHYIGVCTPSLGSFVDPGDLLKDLAEFLNEEPVTEPMVAVPTGVSDPKTLLRAQRKKEGVCPDCGDVTRESAVGVCRDHGKFLG